MGLCMRLHDSRFFISKNNKPKALDALKALARGSMEKIGFTHPGDILDCIYLEDALSKCRWSCTHNDNTDIIGLDFEGEKHGQDHRFFEAISPFVGDGSYLEMRGEDGSHWRWSFNRGKFKEIDAKVSWGDEDE